MTLAYGMRFTAGLPFAAGLSVFLILLMRALVSVDGLPEAEKSGPLDLDFLPTLIDTEVETIAPEPPVDKPEPVIPIMPVPDPVPTDFDGSGGGEILRPTLPPINDGDLDPRGVQLPLTPILLGEQIYPPRMLERGVEGSCVVVFDITGAGTTTNIRSDCDHTGFIREAEKAASKYKYSASDGLVTTIQRLGQAIELEWKMPTD